MTISPETPSSAQWGIAQFKGMWWQIILDEAAI
jgi:hypothetical protein